MLRKMLFAVALAAIIVLGAMAPEAMAGSSDGGEQDARSAAYSMPQQRSSHVAHRSFTGLGGDYGYAMIPKASGFRGPGYIYVPGIVDGACNLPTSACSNEFRNVN